ncbi:NAD(P)H quinone oxidoreductase, PIG3 family protein [Candidatus Poribacteria bacterium]|jgi:putative PIG3 family NAD(P)H quinone oxidoreductase|nr:NAD(P)H quinone oxidoreductase, PIG3 family protein [Candidatus Poribacteria bacterium]
MKAIIKIGDGGPEVLKLGEVKTPKPKSTQLLINVKSTALNRADILQRKGLYPPPAGESEILGLELSGVVEEKGAAVTGFELGDRVFGLVGGGGYAEYAIIDYQMAMHIPDDWSFEKATAVPEVFFTANETLFKLGCLSSDESVLIHAGGSGVGTAGIQMADNVGAKVFITAGSNEKIEKAKMLGCTEGINYKTHDFAELIKNLTEGEGVDVVQDFIGRPYLEKNCSILKPNGRLLIVGLMGGPNAEIDLGIILRKRLQIFGSIMRPLELKEKISITQRFVDRWLPLLQTGVINPVIDTIMPLEKADEAHRYMESNSNFGKIILRI